MQFIQYFFKLFLWFCHLHQAIHFIQHSTSNHFLKSVLYLKLLIFFSTFVTFDIGVWSQAGKHR